MVLAISAVVIFGLLIVMHHLVAPRLIRHQGRLRWAWRKLVGLGVLRKGYAEHFDLHISATVITLFAVGAYGLAMAVGPHESLPPLMFPLAGIWGVALVAPGVSFFLDPGRAGIHAHARRALV